MPDRKIVTRFAPSPTGYLHIGGARTALFCWAFARHHNGTFILRMEDTDAARSTAESTRRIIEDLRWLGLNWDEGPDPDAADVYAIESQRGKFGPYFQSQRGALYREYLDRLVKAGRAYRCFKSQEQLKAERETQKAAGRPMKYDPAESLSRSEADQKALIDRGVPYVWRFRMPDADVTVHDMVLGDVTIKSAELEDFVIMKSEQVGGKSGGGPTFHFANVVDDATMQVTHVLRAQEHLMNTPKHVAMFDALGLPRPKYGHMPLIFNPDGTKMSKRDKAKAARAVAQAWLKANGNDRHAFIDRLFGRREEIKKITDQTRVYSEPMRSISREMIGDFLEKKNDDVDVASVIEDVLKISLPEIDVHDFYSSGYLREVILNYIALLGWNPGGNLPERFGLDWFVQNFTVEGIGKSNAKFDRVKLLAFNGESIGQLPPQEFADRLLDHLMGHPSFLGLCKGGKRFEMFAECYRPRARTLDEPSVTGRFFVAADDAIEFDAKAMSKAVTANSGAGLRALRGIRSIFDSIADTDWNPPTIHGAIERYAADPAHGFKNMGDVAQPLRVAVTGTTVSPEIHTTLAILGKKSTLRRIDRCIAVAEKAG